MHFSGFALNYLVIRGASICCLHGLRLSSFRLLFVHMKWFGCGRHAKNHYNETHLHSSVPGNFIHKRGEQTENDFSNGRTDARTDILLRNQLGMANKLRCSDHRNMFDSIFCVRTEWKVSKVSARQSSITSAGCWKGKNASNRSVFAYHLWLMNFNGPKNGNFRSISSAFFIRPVQHRLSPSFDINEMSIWTAIYCIRNEVSIKLCKSEYVCHAHARQAHFISFPFFLSFSFSFCVFFFFRHWHSMQCWCCILWILVT